MAMDKAHKTARSKTPGKVGVYLGAELRSLAEGQARSENLSLSKWIRKLVSRSVRQVHPVHIVHPSEQVHPADTAISTSVSVNPKPKKVHDAFAQFIARRRERRSHHA